MSKGVQIPSGHADADVIEEAWKTDIDCTHTEGDATHYEISHSTKLLLKNASELSLPAVQRGSPKRASFL